MENKINRHLTIDLKIEKKLIYKRGRMKQLVFLAICKNTSTQVDI